MNYYLIINKINHKYYCGKSSNPQYSINSHINRAFNPNSKRYNTELHIALRQEGIDNFIFYICKFCPDWVEKLNKYTD